MLEQFSPAVFVIVAATVIVTVRGFQQPGFASRYLFDAEAVRDGRQYNRLATSGFLHADWAHLAFNMYSFYAFGRIVEYRLGAVVLLAIYGAGIVGGNLVSLYLHRGGRHRALGASGGVSGVIFATVFLFPGGSVRALLLPVAIPSWLFALVFVVGSYVAMRRRADNVGHDAHLGGALCGLLAATAFYPSLPSRQPLLYAAVVGLTAAFIWFDHRIPDPSGWWRALVGALTGDREARDRRRLDELLAKISRVGLAGLTSRERSDLEKISRRRDRRR